MTVQSLETFFKLLKFKDKESNVTSQINVYIKELHAAFDNAIKQ